jgi:hypothetical protein
MTDSAFDALPPVPETVLIAGEILDLVPLKVGELPGFVRAIRPFAQALTQEVDWLALFGSRGEDLVQALSIACRRPKVWVEGLELDEAIRLAEAVFEVNADFFIRKVAPMATFAAERIGKRLTGLIASSVSSAPGTATPTS